MPDNTNRSFTRTLRRNQTEAEARLWRYLRNRRLAGVKFRRQFPIAAYVADFVCLEHLLIIEIDGGQHAEHVQRDLKRTRYLESRGYRILRFWNNDVLQNMEGVLLSITRALTPALSQRERALSSVSNFDFPKGEGVGRCHPAPSPFGKARVKRLCSTRSPSRGEKAKQRLPTPSPFGRFDSCTPSPFGRGQG